MNSSVKTMERRMQQINLNRSPRAFHLPSEYITLGSKLNVNTESISVEASKADTCYHGAL